MAKTNVKVRVGELKKNFYVHRYKPIRFNGLPIMKIPSRNDIDKKQSPVESKQFPDEFDTIFPSSSEFATWNKDITKDLAELDESMNYCEYFVRESGNKGYYVREGKTFPVDGSWVGIQDFDSCPQTQDFVIWLIQNNWREDWFKLHHRYSQ